jgi:hypothetical protein
MRESIKSARVPDNTDTSTPEGTPVHVVHDYRKYLGTVLSVKIGPHPILGAEHRTALYAVRITHILETRKKRYAYFPTKPRTVKRLIALSIAILPQTETVAA